SNAVAFQVTAGNNPALDGRSVDIPLTASSAVVGSTSAIGFSGGGAQLLSVNAPGTLKVPFTAQIAFLADTNFPLNPLFQVGDTSDKAVQVVFAQDFGGPVVVSGSASGGLSVTSSPAVLSSSGVAHVQFIGSLPGTYFATIDASAGSFDVTLRLTIVVS